MDLPRTQSFESIPDVDFMVQSIQADLAAVNVTEFRIKEAAGQLLPEPLLIPDSSRFVLFPIKHGDVSSSQLLSQIRSKLTIF